MNVDDQIVSSLRDMRKDLNTNHLEVCQRLTALETSQAPLQNLETRVQKLEGWRSKIAGGIIVLGALVSAALGEISWRR